MESEIGTGQIIEHIDALLSARDAGASICPSEVARALSPDQWRLLMAQIRTVAAQLAQDGLLRITQGDRTLDPKAVLAGEVRGPIRLRRA